MLKRCATLTLMAVYSKACVQVGAGRAARAAVLTHAKGTEPGGSQNPSIRVAQSLLDVGVLFNAYLLICA